MANRSLEILVGDDSLTTVELQVFSGDYTTIQFKFEGRVELRDRCGRTITHPGIDFKNLQLNDREARNLAIMILEAQGAQKVILEM